MKQALKTIFAGTLLFTFAIAPLQAQTNTVGETSNSIAPASQAAANAPAFGAKHEPKKTDSDDVVIDKTGIHVGGAEGVNVNWGNDYGSLSKVLPAVVSRTLLTVLLVVAVITFTLSLAVQVPLFFFVTRLSRMTHATLRMMIEKGMPITPEIVAILNPKPHYRPRAVPGLMVTLIGVNLVDSDEHSLGGWIVVFIGIAFLIAWVMECRNYNNPSLQNSSPANQPPKQ